MLSALSDKFKKILNGDDGRPSPMAGAAPDIKLGDRLNEIPAMISGEATVLNGDTTVAVTLDSEDWDSKTVVAGFNGNPGSAKAVWGSVSGSTLTLTVDTDPGADADVSYWIDGR